MANVSWSSLVRSTGVRFGLLVRRVTRTYARVERRLVEYVTLTTPRRRLWRVAGIVLFGCMTVGFMGIGPCEGCLLNEGIPEPLAFFLAVLVDSFLALNVTHGGSGTATPRFTGTDGSQTGVASFAGNFTGITPPSGSYFAMVRMPDCSLGLVAANASNNGTSGTVTGTSVISNYERTLHQLAGLTTTPDVYPKGCVDPKLGISTRIGVALQRQKSGPIVMATVQGYQSNNAIFVLNNKTDFSTGSFTPQPGTAAASAIATADLNGDGNGDLVAVNDYNAASSYVSVLINNGDGTFKTPVNYPTAGNMSVAAVIDDVNGDGKLDIVSVSDDQHISVLLGNGDGSFQAAQSFAAPALPSYAGAMNTPILGLITADVNGDGKKDIVCSNGLVLLGAGNGTFTAASAAAFPYTTASPGGFGPQLAAGDLNNDGKTDLVLDTGSTVTLWMGNGNGTFTQGQTYATLNNSGYVTVTDLDGDGNLDIYTGLANEGLFSGDDSDRSTGYVLMGHGDGTFAGAPQATGAYNGSNMGDVNGDGVPDLITNGTLNSPVATFTVQVGNGKGGFTTASTITAPASFTGNSSALTSPVTIVNANTVAATSYAVGDVNGDGKADLVFIDNGLTAINPGNNQPITYPSAVLFVALSNGDGTFQTPIPYSIPQIAPAADFDSSVNINQVLIADFNHDGKNDLLLTYNETGGASFGQPAINAYNQGFVVMLGTGNGTFSTTGILTSTYSSNTAPTTAFVPQILSTTDLNGDNKPDLMVNAPGTTIVNFQLQTVLQTYVGNGDGTFKTPTTVAVGANEYGAPVLADLNKDGKLDLAILAETAAGQAELVTVPGNGDGTFGTPSVTNLTGGDSIRSAALAGGDFDGDGNVDLVLIDSEDFSGVFYGKGNGTFTSVPASGYVVPKDLINVAAGAPAVVVDLNKDGKPDILAGSTVLLNLYGAAPVIPATTTLGLTASATAIAPGGSLKLTATVTPAAGSTATPTGTVTFKNGTTTIGTGTVRAGVATLTTTSLTVTGTDTVSASYSGDTDFSGSPSAGVNVTVTSGAQTATLALAASPGNSTTVNQVVTFTATLGGVSFTPIAPTGNVTFTANGTAISGCNPVAVNTTTGVATCTASALAAGSIAIAATYAGDPNFTVASPATATQTVSPFAAGLAVVAVPGSSVAVNTNVTFTASLTGTGIAFTPISPSGTVKFTTGGTTIAGCSAVAISAATGKASCSTSALTQGANAIAATYSGDTSFTAAAPATATETVTAFAATLSLSDSRTSSTINQAVTLTATLTGSFSPIAPSGNVTFTANGIAIAGCSAMPLTTPAETASCTTSALTAGTYPLAANYATDVNFTVATQPTVTQTIAPFAAGMSLSASPSNTTAAGAAVTFTATLTGSGIAFTPIAPAGKVAFTANGTTITGCGAVAVSAVGVATCTTSSLAAGSDAIVAAYSGDTNFTVASPATATQTVTSAPGFSLTPTAATLSFAKGATAGNSTTITVAPAGGFTGSVALAAAVTASPNGAVNLPVPSFGATSPVVISGAGSGSATLTISTTAATSGALVVPARPGVRYVPVALAGVLLLLLPRRRRGLGLMMVLLTALGGGLIGCGGHPSSSTAGSPGTTSGNYTITVTATSGSLSTQTTVTATVQ